MSSAPERLTYPHSYPQELLACWWSRVGHGELKLDAVQAAWPKVNSSSQNLWICVSIFVSARLRCAVHPELHHAIGGLRGAIVDEEAYINELQGGLNIPRRALEAG